MSESLGQTSDASWLAAKEAALAAVRAAQTLLEVAVERAVSRAEGVIEDIDARVSNSPGPDSLAQEADSPGEEADSPGEEADPRAQEAGASAQIAGGPAGETPRLAGGRAQDDRPGPDRSETEQPGSSLAKVLSDLLEAGLRLAVDLVDRLAGRLEEVVAGGGVAPAAGLGAAVAALAGRNPIWGAIKGGFSSLSPGAKVVVIIALVLAAILLPVTVLLLVIALIIIILVVAAKTRSRHS